MITWMIFKNLMIQISIPGSKTGFRNGADQTQVSLIVYNYIFLLYFYALYKFAINKNSYENSLFWGCTKFCAKSLHKVYAISLVLSMALHRAIKC